MVWQIVSLNGASQYCYTCILVSIFHLGCTEPRIYCSRKNWYHTEEVAGNVAELLNWAWSIAVYRTLSCFLAFAIWNRGTSYVSRTWLFDI